MLAALPGKMIKLIIFDLDGVLIDARELHYEALNKALFSIDQKFTINKEEHLSTYDGLPTTKKLELLTKNKNLPKESYSTIWANKQKYTKEIIDFGFSFDEKIRKVLSKLKQDEYKIYVASNSIRETVKMSLLRKGFLINFIVLSIT